jgi:hypothetical protein
VSEKSDDQHWWSKPKAIVLAIVAFIAGFAGLIKNEQTISTFFGLNTKPTLSVQLQTSEAAAARDTIINLANASPNLYLLDVSVVKSGPGVLHDCNFSVWADGVTTEVRIPRTPLVIPDGLFRETIMINFETPSLGVLSSFRDGTVSLICDAGGSPSVPFTFRHRKTD